MEGMARWRGRVALVTGASSGIGREVASALALDGLKVAACARRLAPLQALQGELAERGGDLLPLQANLRDETQITAVFEAIRARWGGVDVLVNNAGLGRNAPLTSGRTEAWREMLEVNVLALCICTREAVRDMRRRGDDGHVVHISSMAGHRVPKGSGVYSATKFAVRSLTEGLRLELHHAGSHIRVSAISPGFVETGFAATYHGSEEAARKTYSRFKALEAADIAGAVRFALAAPPHMAIHDVLVRPTEQPT